MCRDRCGSVSVSAFSAPRPPGGPRCPGQETDSGYLGLGRDQHTTSGTKRMEKRGGERRERERERVNDKVSFNACAICKRDLSEVKGEGAYVKVIRTSCSCSARTLHSHAQEEQSDFCCSATNHAIDACNAMELPTIVCLAILLNRLLCILVLSIGGLAGLNIVARVVAVVHVAPRACAHIRRFCRSDAAGPLESSGELAR